MEDIKLSIVLPTYNECENIKVLIPQIEEIFKDIVFEVIVVDDNSPDGTADIVVELNNKYGNIRLLRRKQKQGIGAALRDGYNNAEGKIILSSDTDLSFCVADMRRLFDVVNNGYDLVVGCRHSITGSFYEMKNISTKIKGLISRIGNRILNFLTGMNIHDFSANFRAIRQQAWGNLDIKENNNLILFEMLIKANYKRMRITEIPVSFMDRVYGKSKLNLCIEIPKIILKSIYYLVKYSSHF